MKKYVKPELFYERYELSQHIADCAWELNYGSDKECKASPDQDKLVGMTGTLFTTTLSCDWTTDDGGYQEYCYQGGAAHANVFIS